jgi:predicted acetyltransferase
MNIRALRVSEQEECLDLWAAAFPETGRDYFIKYFRGDATWRPEDTIVCEDQGRLVSAVSIVRRTVARGDLRLNMAGIANVGTLPEERGKGRSTACLRRAIAYMEAEPFDFSLLGTGIHDYYARLGWMITPFPAYSATISEDFPRYASGVRPATAADLPAIRALYTSYNAGRPLTVERPDWYWSGWLNVQDTNVPENLLVAESSEQVTGYLRYKLNDEMVQILEIAATDSDTEKRLLVAVVAVAENRKNAYIPAALSPEAWALFSDRRNDFAGWWMSRVTVPLRFVEKLAVQCEMETAKVAALLNSLERGKAFAYLYGVEEPDTDELRAVFPPAPAAAWYEWDGF